MYLHPGGYATTGLWSTMRDHVAVRGSSYGQKCRRAALLTRYERRRLGFSAQELAMARKDLARRMEEVWASYKRELFWAIQRVNRKLGDDEFSKKPTSSLSWY